MRGGADLKRLVAFLYFSTCASLFFSVTAQAYIDPSAMTYIIQIIAGAAIALGAAASFYFRKLKRKFTKLGKKREENTPYFTEEDDDDVGFGDYEIESAAGASQAAAPKQAMPEAPLAEKTGIWTEPVTVTPDPYDEEGGVGLATENRELRRMLAEERQKVEDLKRALHICTASRK